MASLRATKHKVRRTLFCCLCIHRCQNVALLSNRNHPCYWLGDAPDSWSIVSIASGHEFVFRALVGSVANVGWRAMRGGCGRFTRPLWELQTVRCGYLFCRSRRLFHNWLCATRARAAEFRAPDRTALRYLPHRFSRAYPVRPTVQAARIYRRRRRIPHDAILFQRRAARARRTRQAARLCEDTGYAGERAATRSMFRRSR